MYSIAVPIYNRNLYADVVSKFSDTVHSRRAEQCFRLIATDATRALARCCGQVVKWMITVGMHQGYQLHIMQRE